MEVRFHTDVDEFRDVAFELYRRDPVRLTVELLALGGAAGPVDAVAVQCHSAVKRRTSTSSPAWINEFLMTEVDGMAVSVAGVRAPIAGMTRIGPVFTPTERRGNGFGSAVTAAAATWALSVGARDVVLFTDLANPISNRIYQRIGFVPVGDAARFDFTARPPAAPK
ncbi:MAG: GNAT family N-acetyltransferase [Mycobacterium sp.]